MKQTINRQFGEYKFTISMEGPDGSKLSVIFQRLQRLLELDAKELLKEDPKKIGGCNGC